MAVITCKYCEAKVDEAVEVCPKCGADPRPEEGVTPLRTRPLAGESCLRCGGDLLHFGEQRLRFGGTAGVWKLVFGELAELGEDAVPVEVLVCENCRHMEFRLSPDVK